MSNIITRDDLFIKDESGEMIIAPNAMNRICEIETQKKALDKEYKKYKEVLKSGMEFYGLKKIETDDLVISYVEPFEKTVIDSDRLWSEYKDVAIICQKDQQVSSSIRVKVR